MTLNPAQRSYIVQSVGIPLVKVGILDLYWVRAERRVAYRNVYPAERKRKPLPEGAIYVGRYEHPCHPDVYVGDIEAVIEDQTLPASPWDGGVYNVEAAA